MKEERDESNEEKEKGKGEKVVERGRREGKGKEERDIHV